MNELQKQYLGDGVCATFDGYAIELRANYFENPTDRIVLEPKVLAALNAFYDRCIRAQRESNGAGVV